jgi:hypothetical protein
LKKGVTSSLERPPNAPKRPLDEDYAYEQDADYRQIQKLKPSPVESKRENVSALHQARSVLFIYLFYIFTFIYLYIIY